MQIKRKDAVRLLKQIRTDAIELGFDGKATDGEAIDAFLTELNVEHKHAGEKITAKAMLEIIGGVLEVNPVEEPVETNEIDEDEEEKGYDEEEEKGKARGKQLRQTIAKSHAPTTKGRSMDRLKAKYDRSARLGKTGFIDSDAACEFIAATRLAMYASVKGAAKLSPYVESGQYRKDLETMSVKDASSVDPTLGGSLLREAFDQNVIVIKDRFGVARQLADVITSPEKVYRYTLDGVDNQVFWTGEAMQIQDSEGKFEPQALIANKIAGIDFIPMEVFTAPGVDMADKLAVKMYRQITKREDIAYIDGNGEANNGGFIGLKWRLRNLAVANTGIDGLQVQGTSNTFAAITIGDLHGVMGRVTKGNPEDYTWLVSHRFFWDVMARLTQTANGTDRRQTEEGPRYFFEGSPVVIDNSGAMPSAGGTADRVVALYGDFKTSSRMLEVSNSVRFSTSEDFRFDTDEVGIKFTEQIAFNIHGQGTAAEAGAYAGLVTPA